MNSRTDVPRRRSRDTRARPMKPPLPVTAIGLVLLVSAFTEAPPYVDTPPRPRLLVFTSTFPRSVDDGTPPFVRDLSIVEARTFETMVLTQRVPESREYELTDGMAVVRFPYFWRRFENVADGATLENVRARRSGLLQLPFLMLSQVLALRRAIRRFDPDVLHIHWIIPQGLAALLVARDRPWLVTSPGVDVYALNGKIWRALKSSIVGRASLVTTMNEDMRERLIDLGAAPDRVLVLPMGADLDRVTRSASGLAPIPGRILFAGRMVEKKGLAVLLDALERIGTTEWSLAVVGDGPLRSQLERHAARLNGQVRFLGQLTPERLAAEYRRSELVVVPSVPARSGDQDGLPVVLLEAMASGCAIVASELPGLAEAISDGHDGVLVPPGDVVALSGAIDRLLRDPAERARLGDQARLAVAGVRDRDDRQPLHRPARAHPTSTELNPQRRGQRRRAAAMYPREAYRAMPRTPPWDRMSGASACCGRVTSARAHG